MCLCFFFFKQKTAYEMRISDWSSDVCSSDLHHRRVDLVVATARDPHPRVTWHPDGGGRTGPRVDPDQLDGVGAAARHLLTATRVRAEGRTEELRVGEGWVSTCRF